MVAAGPAEFRAVVLSLRDGSQVTLRAIREDDRQMLQAALRALSSESRYSRFMSAVRELSPAMLDRATSPEAHREFQLVAVVGSGSDEAIVAGTRYCPSADTTVCEFAIAVVDAWQGRGLASQLLQALMQAARARGFEGMEGYILASNARMLKLARRLGFVEVDSPEGPSVRLVRCDLTRMP